jgi:hypothetical protein
MFASRQEQLAAGSGAWAHRTPVGSRTRTHGVAGREEHGQLVSGQALGSAVSGLGPPRETAPRQPLVAKPKSLTIVCE